MKSNDKGFTLIELLVSAAILGLIAIAAMGLMTTGARSYSAVGYSLRLQYEAQTAMSHLQEQVMDCNGGVVWDGSTLFLLQLDPQGDIDKDRLHVYRFREGCIYYGNVPAKQAEPENAATDLLAEYVTDFQAEITNAAGTARTVNLTIALERRNKAYTGTHTIALRNTPRTAASLHALLGTGGT